MEADGLELRYNVALQRRHHQGGGEEGVVTCPPERWGQARTAAHLLRLSQVPLVELAHPPDVELTASAEARGCTVPPQEARGGHIRDRTPKRGSSGTRSCTLPQDQAPGRGRPGPERPAVRPAN